MSSNRVYFGVAILVAILSLALYLTYQKKAFENYYSQEKEPSVEDQFEKIVHGEKPQPKPQRSDQSRVETKGDGMTNDKQKKRQQRDLKTQKETEHDDIPKGHLKYLGDHGSPIIHGEVEEIDFVPNGRDFYQHFMKKRKPLVMRGAIKQWPAVKHWANESYLRENYGEVIFDIQFSKKYETILPIKKTMTLNEYLDIYKTENVYLDCPFPQSNMTKDILVPYCLQCDEFNDAISSTHLLFSNGNTSSSLHFDGYENLLSVITGYKEVLVANYSDTEYFYMKNYTTVNIEAPVDPEAVDLIRFPKLAEVPFHKVTINAGDILYIPEGWWHHVRSFNSPNIAISLWFGIFKENTTDALELEDSLDAIQRLDEFGKAVEEAPETIECKKQNRPISEVYWPKQNSDAPHLDNPDEWTVELRNGYKMPRKGFGAAFLKDHKATVLTALKAGYRMIDTAQAHMYDEKAVGEAVKESGIPREEVFVVSKVHPQNMGFEDTFTSVDESLTKLQMSYIDLMLIHASECDDNPDYLGCEKGMPRGTWKDCWKALEALVDNGKIRSIGVSNFDLDLLKELKEIARIQPAVVQNFFTPFYQDKETRTYCKENNIKFVGYSTLGSQYTFDFGFEVNPVLNDEGLNKIAKHFDASVAQVVLKWALDNDVIVIPRSNTPNHINTNFNLHHVFLSEKDKLYFDKLDGKFNDIEDDNSTEAKQEDQVKKERGKTERKAPVRNKEIINTLVLEKKVNPEDATLYVSSDDQWIYAIDAVNGDLMWKYGTAEDGGSRCAFSVDETVVYCGTDDKHMRAFNRLDGTLIWKYVVGGAIVSSTRVGNDGTLYFGCLDGFMYALKPDGSLRWKTDLKEQIWSSPALKDGGRVVFIGSMNEASHNIHALNGETGDIIWQYKTAGPVFSSPALSQDEKVLYLCSFDGNCYACDSDSGKILWTFEGDSAFQSSPIISHTYQQMYIASTNGMVYAININTGSSVWTYKSKGEFFSSAFPSDNGDVYIGSGDGEVLALTQEKGELVWKFETETTDTLYSTPRMTNDGILYIGGIDGYLYALNSETGKVVWKFKTYGPLVGTVRIPSRHDKPIH